MGEVRVDSFTISIDGFAAGPGQSLDDPLGAGGTALHEWFRPTRTFQRRVLGNQDGESGVDDDFAARGFDGIGAWILGRHMFTPSRGAWPDDGWRGWWGDEPPYHCDVFVLSHHARAPLVMAGGTTFHFVTDGPEAALALARDAAGGADVRIGGGAATIRQYLQAGLIDRLHLAVAPVLLGRGESLLAGFDLPALGYRVARSAPGARAMHVLIERVPGA
ncbi:dihydrofolate reductase family protein [Luteimonas deserti]|uniref:Dihydrofolate reductase family protein n=1 Tax=Luteimonas deserti TaxID=2752306 RepID=A0A7Z0QQN1_9GAMM|nr:dihydrofolate reductase family protein [Luteimonas deserti]NYZ62191.1 dihydrofolate reductase family protein [Luteimonas deserti]